MKGVHLVVGSVSVAAVAITAIAMGHDGYLAMFAVGAICGILGYGGKSWQVSRRK